MNDLRYPIGVFVLPPSCTNEERQTCIRQIEETPAALRRAIHKLSGTQLDHPYRDGGWTIRQVVHHLADSHMNAYVRFKLTVTEECPMVKPYDESAWSLLPDAVTGDIDMSLLLLTALHQRWTLFLRSMSAEQFSRSFNHPEYGPRTLDQTLAMYAWHGRHHVAHITEWRKRKGW